MATFLYPNKTYLKNTSGFQFSCNGISKTNIKSFLGIVSVLKTIVICRKVLKSNPKIN